MSEEKIYDTALIGGGLAGLCAAVLLAKKGRSVILFEKETYPFHKVCGEYISMESWDFLCKEIGLPLQEMNLPLMNKLELSSPGGHILRTNLDTGGFGISRFKIDYMIMEKATSSGAFVSDGTKVNKVHFAQEIFTIETSAGSFKSRTCCGSWGKRSNMDIKWNRSFINKNSARLNNYAGIKYHVRCTASADTIYLNNFKDGYCGLSKIEDDLYCLCWFSKASNLKKAGSIELAEQTILSENPALKKLLDTAEKVNRLPLAISQVSLDKKSAVENHVLMLGDAAGMISPLCGNGMSIAMRSAKIAAEELNLFLNKNIDRKQLEINYGKKRQAAFGKRIRAGRIIQSLFGRKKITDLFVKWMKKSNWLSGKMIGMTHGKNF